MTKSSFFSRMIGKRAGEGVGVVSSLSSKKYKDCSWTFDLRVSVFPIQTTLKSKRGREVLLFIGNLAIFRTT